MLRLNFEEWQFFQSGVEVPVKQVPCCSQTPNLRWKHLVQLQLPMAILQKTRSLNEDQQQDLPKL